MAETALAEIPPVMEWNRTDLVIRPHLEYWEWARLGRSLKDMNGSIQWWMGTWMLYGEAHYGEQAADAVEPYAAQTIHNCTWVTSRFPPSRRRENLSFGHHAEVAALEPTVVDEWLDKAEAGGWTRAKLREEVRRVKMGEPEDVATDVYDAPYTCKFAQCRAQTERLRQEVAERSVCKHCGAAWDS
jgi:hypothetical protein